MTRAESEVFRTSPPTKRARRQARFLHAYARYGTILAACKAAGVSWDTAQRWLHDDHFFQRWVRNHEKFLDRLKGRLYAKAAEGHAPSLHLLLRLAAKDQELLAHFDDGEDYLEEQGEE